MSEVTPRFGLPLLAAGQAQKELYHNEAIGALEALLQPVAMTLGDDAPPAAPRPGQSWIVGTAPTAEWAGEAAALASWTEGGWRFAAPIEGMSAWVSALGLPARYLDGAWTTGVVSATTLVVGGVEVVGARRPAIAEPVAGNTIDAEARLAIAAVLQALRAHGLIAS